MEVSVSELRNDIFCAIKSMISRWHGVFKKERLSVELNPKPDRPEYVVNGQNVYNVSPLNCLDLLSFRLRYRMSVYRAEVLNLQSISNHLKDWFLNFDP